MQSIILFMSFIGILLIIHAIYEQKYQALKNNTRVEYRFIPRTYYEEQLGNDTVSADFKNMFQGSVSPWFERVVTLANPQGDRTPAPIGPPNEPPR